MKIRILRILASALIGAEDNLSRANMMFGKMTEDDLRQEYGNSGRSRGNILEEYQNEVAELKQCIEWVKNA